VLDIFGGAGSTYHAAQIHGRRWIGCEIGDVSPLLSRIKTFFGLEKRSRVSRDLSTHFQADFIKKQVADYIRDHRTSEFDQISPQKITKSMQGYVSKSRVFD
jgi:site-specific DNA-methyltransferase (adenine-specific)